MAIYYSYREGETVGKLVGETLRVVAGMEKGSERIEFECESGRKFLMWYEHDCCASCNVEDVCGDVSDLIGSPILLAEDVSNDTSLIPAGGPEAYPAESETWTFVKFATVKGYVTLRWYGSSNGYYSEEPTFCEVQSDQG